MSITRKCPWCGEDHLLKPSKERPGRLIAICSLLGRAYCKATFDALIDNVGSEAMLAAKIAAELGEEEE